MVREIHLGKVTTAEWTAEQKGAGVALISQLSGLHEGECGLEIDENEPARGETRHN